MKISRESIKGKRESNQDYTQIAENKKAYTLAVLCDGMGGHQAGDKASQLVATQLANQWQETDLATRDAIVPWLKETINAINTDIYELGLDDSDLFGMGSTVVLAVILDQELIIANVGDSRAYQYVNQSVTLLTDDHSFAYELYLKGQISKEEAETHYQRNMLTRSLGLPNDVTVDIFELGLEDVELILLCSDGLSDTLSNEEMAEIIGQSETLEGATDKLVEQAYANGSTDNITVMIIDLIKSGEEDELSDRL